MTMETGVGDWFFQSSNRISPQKKNEEIADDENELNFTILKKKTDKNHT